jgi:hypothetical protein
MKLPAGIETISGQSEQSRKVSPGRGAEVVGSDGAGAGGTAGEDGGVGPQALRSAARDKIAKPDLNICLHLERGHSSRPGISLV